MNSIDSTFSETESLIRAVYPENRRPDFWTGKRISSAALKDKNGLSVTRTYDRTIKDTVDWMKIHFNGVMVSISVQACNRVRAYLKYCPSKRNAYHSEIHSSESIVELTDEQAIVLARSAVIEHEPEY